MFAKRTTIFALLVSFAAMATAQSWVRPYESALRLAKAGVWAEARAQFLEAVKERPEDTERASQVGGSVADRRPWRGGTPYSPNFGAAYSSFKLAASAPDVKQRDEHLKDSITGFQALLNKGQVSTETMLFLAAALSANNQVKEASDIQTRAQSLEPDKAFKIDREILDPADIAALQGTTLPVGVTGGDPRTGGPVPGQLPLVGIGTKTGVVPALDFKYALLIGNNAPDGPAHGENDVDLLKEALIKHAGYPEANIVVLKGASSASIVEAAKGLSDKMPDSGTALVFYTGPATFDPKTGKDYLGASESGDKVAKLELFQSFVAKGASVFAFFQVDRPMDLEGRYFGMEVPEFGRIAQMQGTSPGEKTYATFAEGKSYGVYAHAMAQGLEDTRDNRIAISDFVWNTFYKIRKGAADGSGGGAQTPTLPVVVSMTTSARF